MFALNISCIKAPFIMHSLISKITEKSSEIIVFKVLMDRLFNLGTLHFFNTSKLLNMKAHTRGYAYHLATPFYTKGISLSICLLDKILFCMKYIIEKLSFKRMDGCPCLCLIDVCTRYICSVGMSGTSRLILLLVLQTGLVSGPGTSRL
jgi:hypothetical protein